MTTQNRIARWAALAGAAALCHAPALAGRPFSTEDAGVIGKGTCEVEAFSERLRPAGGPNESGLSAQLGCGIIGATQLAFALAASKAAGEKSRAMLFSGKTQFVDGGENAPSFALAYFLSRDRAPNESWRSAASGVNGVVTAPVQGWLVHVNLGVTAERAPSRNVTGWALAFERPAVVKGVDAGFEFFGDDRNTHWAQVAARWHAVPEQLLLDASLGKQTSGGSTDRLTVGLKWIF
jgi:hypothetical protein